MDLIDDPENEEQIDEKAEKKKLKIEKEKKKLINNLVAGNIKSTRERVAFILNDYVPARNSDTDLAWEYWKTFENDIFLGGIRTKEQLRSLTSLNSITRSRARIQNEYKLFQADEEVKSYRGLLQEEKKQEAIEQKPNWPFYEIFMDETGKTQQYLSVGSLWIVDPRSKAFAYRKLYDWCTLHKIKFEFHFSKVSKNRLDIYKSFFSKFLSWNPSAGFKAIIVENKGFSNINSAITDLTYHLIYDGIQHEDDTKRAPLPRLLQVRVDDENPGLDQVKLKNLAERIQSQKIEGLELDSFLAIDSSKNFFIQAVDLFTSAINRKLHFPEGSGHVKDELADFILDLVGFNINEVDKNNNKVDRAKVFNLSFNKEKIKEEFEKYT